MIDQWFKKDLENIYSKHHIVVFIDETGDGRFLLDTVRDQYKVHEAHTEIEDLHTKYLVEQEQPLQTKVLIYTNLKKNELKFLREYCETNGYIEIRYIQNYIKEKVHTWLNLNINLKDDELVTAAKLSIGKDKHYWYNLSHKGEAAIFDLEKELLPFLHDPETHVREKFDSQLADIFYRKVNKLLGQEYINKPVRTLANEVVTAMLDGLAMNNCDPLLEKVYENWLDSVSCRDSFFHYLENYKLPKQLDIKTISINHPFREIDLKWLKAIGNSLKDKKELRQWISGVKARLQSKQAKTLKIDFWQDVIVLMQFDEDNIATLNSFAECVEYYTGEFYKVDAAMRSLYTNFLENNSLITPFQDYYKQAVTVLYDKWFRFTDGYQENQSGLLQRIIDKNQGKTAIIVSDAVTYEIARKVAAEVPSRYKFSPNVILTDLPSDTENNMSRIYMNKDETSDDKSYREQYFANKNSDKQIDFVNLDTIGNEVESAHYLICTYKDLDSLGEKIQQNALKYFNRSISYFADKISQLLKIGYQKVYLISDHGFVLTGVLTDADKISVELSGDHAKSERFIRTVEQQTQLGDNYIEIKKQYDKYNYLYLSKNMHPFKTTGAYGFAHGGMTPQEIITPCFSWELSDQSTEALDVEINNKQELTNVTGELFEIELKAGEGSGGIFSVSRKVYLVFFSDNQQINKSDVMTIRQEETIHKEFTMDAHSTIEVQLLDAKTKLQLDKAKIQQSKDRDLEGLL